MTASSPAENGGSEPTPAPTKQAGCKSVSENGLNSPVDDATTAADDAPGGNSYHLSENQDAQASTALVVSASKRSRPPYKYDPHKITLRFLFANRDGLTVTVECNPTDTVGEVKRALLSVWPEDLPDCSGANQLRLICMGKGVLMPDNRSLEDCQVPVFKSHPTPINVSVRPETVEAGVPKEGNEGKSGRGSSGAAVGLSASRTTSSTSGEADQGCACIIL